MRTRSVRINVTGRISGHAASTLGGWVEESDEGNNTFELMVNVQP